MKKNFAVFAMVAVMFVVAALGVSAEETVTVQKFEGELNVGITAPIGGAYGGKNLPGASFGLEGRYNILRTGWDCGLLFNMSYARRSFRGDVEWDGTLYEDVFRVYQRNISFRFMATGGYNFRQGKKVNPYAGIAIGVAEHNANNFFGIPGERCTSFSFAPRVGVELWRHLRIGASFYVGNRPYNTFVLSIGGVIGGRPRK